MNYLKLVIFLLLIFIVGLFGGLFLFKGLNKNKNNEFLLNEKQKNEIKQQTKDEQKQQFYLKHLVEDDVEKQQKQFVDEKQQDKFVVEQQKRDKIEEKQIAIVTKSKQKFVTLELLEATGEEVSQCRLFNFGLM